MKKRILYTISISWSLLGYIRGINSYDYVYKKYNNGILLNNNLYATKIYHGFIGSIFYITPGVNFIMLYKEMYRLNVNIRNLEYEKKSDFYNLLL